MNGRGDTDDTDSAMIFEVARVVDIDPTITDVADLPLGWRAWRATPSDPWERAAQ